MHTAGRCLFVFVLLAGIGRSQPACAGAIAAADGNGRSQLTLPGEFELQDAVLLGWDADDVFVQQSLLDIIRAIHNQLHVILVVADEFAGRNASEMLEAARIDPTTLQIVQLPIDSIWTRDYGPMIIRTTRGNPHVIDAEYGQQNRGNDDLLPSELATLLQMPAQRVALAVDGGNLLSNGAGLCIATEALLESNLILGYSREEIEGIIRETYGAKRVLFLERLIGEESGHVDMFATFTARDTVVVGEYTWEEDPLNAEILDRNADRLAEVMTPSGPLIVVRIPMGRRDFEVWRTYTNVLYANGTLLIPIYPGIDPSGEAKARMVFRQLLPDWRIVGVDCTQLIEWGGAIHCVTMNLYRLPAHRDWAVRRTGRSRDIFEPAPGESHELREDDWELHSRALPIPIRGGEIDLRGRRDMRLARPAGNSGHRWSRRQDDRRLDRP